MGTSPVTLVVVDDLTVPITAWGPNQQPVLILAEGTPTKDLWPHLERSPFLKPEHLAYLYTHLPTPRITRNLLTAA